jgi:hypothetical protein
MATVRDELTTKAKLSRNIEILKHSPGWNDLEDYLTARECKLIRMIMKGKEENLKSCRDRLNEIQDFKKFLDVALSDGAAAVKELAVYDKKYGQMG